MRNEKCKNAEEKNIQNQDRHGTTERIAPRIHPTKLCKPLRCVVADAHTHTGFCEAWVGFKFKVIGVDPMVVAHVKVKLLLSSIS